MGPNGTGRPETDSAISFRWPDSAAGTRYYLVIEGREARRAGSRSEWLVWHGARPDHGRMSVRSRHRSSTTSGTSGMGSRIFHSMTKLSPILSQLPAFNCPTGDNLPDRDTRRDHGRPVPAALAEDVLAPRSGRDFFRNVPGYWEKDDQTLLPTTATRRSCAVDRAADVCPRGGRVREQVPLATRFSGLPAGVGACKSG